MSRAYLRSAIVMNNSSVKDATEIDYLITNKQLKVQRNMVSWSSFSFIGLGVKRLTYFRLQGV